MDMRLSLILALLLAACGAAPAREAVPPRSLVARPAGPLLDRVPFQQWPRLPARTVGLLVAYDSPYGELIGWTRSLRRLEPEPRRRDNHRYYFVTDGMSPQATYFTARRGEGENFMPEWSLGTVAEGTMRFHGVAMFAPRRNPYGLRAPAHLVEVEVNRGAGAPPGLHFVATDVTVLDGTSAYPIVVDDALTEARRRFDHELETGGRELAAALAAAARLRGGAPFGPETTTTWEGVFPTWLQQERRLRVFFYRAVVVTSTKRELVTIAPRCPLRAPCMPPHPEEVLRVRGHGVERGLEVDFDDQGRASDERVYAPAPMSREALLRVGVRVE
jgi:hypothetical protein